MRSTTGCHPERSEGSAGKCRFLVAALLGMTVGATDLVAQTIAITGGKVYTMAGAPIENATVLIRDGRIVQVGANVTVPADAQRINASGKWVTPGLINAGTQLGLIEVSQEQVTRDVSARGKDGVAAAFNVWEGMNPASVMIAPARSEGITTVMVAPQGGMISGQAAMMDLVEGGVADMLARAPVAMVVQVDKGAAGLNARAEVFGKLREIIEDVRAYASRKADYEKAGTRAFSLGRTDLDALIPVAERRMPLVVIADKASDIEATIKFAADANVRVIVAGGAEAWMVAAKLATARIPVMTGAMNNIPGGFSNLASYQENAALLRRAGVDVILINDSGVSDGGSFNVRNIKQEAGNAVAYGMSWDDALAAVTSVPARVFGIADRYGSLEAGKVANVVVWSGDPFELSSRAEHVLVRGVESTTPSRQDMLMQRYRTLPPDFKRP
jgi:imidazolonepropionase-like amidohydrolase